MEYGCGGLIMEDIRFNRLLLIAAMIFFSTTAKGQDISQFERQLVSIFSEIKTSLNDEYEVDQLRSSSEELVSDIEYFKKRNDNLSSNLIFKLNQINTEAEKLVRFFYVIDRSGGMIEKNDFFKIINEAGGNITTVLSNSACANILKVDLGDFSAFIAENNSRSKSYKVKWSLTNTTYGLVGSSGEMGLIRRNVRHLVNSRDSEDFKLLKPKSILCVEEIPYDFE